MTLDALCELYLAEGAVHKKPTTLRSDRGRIKNHIVPLLGKLRIDRITRADVERLQREVAAGRTSSAGTAAAASWQPQPGRTRHGGAGRIGAGRHNDLRG
jgi:hypothetical protein